eukprot:TRINITY_DN2204_c0_g1_i2.p2 TRINITY_DN2204_c0_g1~~TRINITY_DN2204_c0_g1_i2.p2  ORF type:complete len:173 (+),score=22.43 TRINITY_DN2204_c0_g1_i2:119-637(+)
MPAAALFPVVLMSLVTLASALDPFLTAYAADPATVVLPSGLMYRELRPGTGGSPLDSTPCKCHYEGRLSTNYPNGATFDSSYQRGQPTTFSPRQVIPAWREAMPLMKEGAKWELVCPPELAYGPRGHGSLIPPNSILVFALEMNSCSLKQKLRMLPNGPQDHGVSMLSLIHI